MVHLKKYGLFTVQKKNKQQHLCHWDLVYTIVNSKWNSLEENGTDARADVIQWLLLTI